VSESNNVPNGVTLPTGEGQPATIQRVTQEEVDQQYRKRLLEEIIKAVNENDDLHAKLRMALECNP
jgi:hypothetical protein